MTALSLDMLRKLQSATPTETWSALFAFAWQTCSPKFPNGKATAEISRRDRAIGAADLFLATAGWDLWKDYYDCVTKTSDQLIKWWEQTPTGKAILVLDALSLREAPWIIHEAETRGYKIHSAEATGAELPADTNPFAKALGFPQRSSIENNGAGGAHKLSGAKTESVDLPWTDCVDLIDASADWFFWHHWPDDRIHDLCGPGHGLAALANEAGEQLTNDSFWAFVERLTTGRRLVITGDHGYAATGLFPDTSDSKQSLHLKNRFKSGRSTLADDSASNWVPPIDIMLDTPHGKHVFALGRRKWKSQGGYPTLAHGGLSLLEVAVPFVELSRPIGSEHGST